MSKFDLNKQIVELINQLSVSKRIGFLLGAGISMALGIPGIIRLTEDVEKNLAEDKKDTWNKVTQSIIGDSDKSVNVEDILNQVRLIRQITRESENKHFEGVNGVKAKDLDKESCDTIYRLINEKEKDADFTMPKKFISWLNWLSRDFSKEIFTLNYDLVLEKSFEELQIPYFDGFVGAYEPFFIPEGINRDTSHEIPPLSWIRLWKIHGSFGWFWKKNPLTNTFKVVRLGVMAKALGEDRELVIYPSREKYESSRKQPFISYFDRLKDYLLEGEGLFIITGYSFSDDHVNEIIFNCLKQNNRIHVIAFCYLDEEVEKIKDFASSFLNLTVFGPKTGVISGTYGEWVMGENASMPEFYWDSSNECLMLGDFESLVKFLVECSGKKELIEKELIQS